MTSPAGDPLPARSGWERYWETQPQPNDPLIVTLCVSDLTPSVGQRVVATVVADDPDAVIFDGPCDVTVVWDESQDYCQRALDVTQPRRPTPREQPGHQELRFQYTYRDRGAATVVARAWSGEDDGQRHPYKSYSAVELRLTVR